MRLLLVLLIVTSPAFAQPPWWQHVKQARAAYQQKQDAQAMQLYEQALTELEATRVLTTKEERISLTNLLPDLTRPFSRAHKKARGELEKSGASREDVDAFDRQHNRKTLSLLRRAVAIEKRLLGPQDPATLDAIKNLQAREKLLRT